VTAPAYAFKADSHSSHALMLDWLGDGRGRRVLDVGAADGLLARRLSERGWRVTAIEGDPALAAAAAPHVERLVRADLNAGVPAVDGPFHAIVYGDVLEHLVDPLTVLRGLNRALGPAGVILVSIPNVAHLWMRLSLLGGRFQYGDRGILDRTHLRFFTERSLRDLLREAHVSIERWTATPVPLHQVVPPAWQGRWLDTLHAASAVVSRRVPRLLGYQFVVLGRPEESVPRSGRAG
jgi:2-polyprenyl-3-methyl-5-hydroxy-6-metoxy-1,4-benzoquinol methylase